MMALQSARIVAIDAISNHYQNVTARIHTGSDCFGGSISSPVASERGVALGILQLLTTYNTANTPSTVRLQLLKSETSAGCTLE